MGISTIDVGGSIFAEIPDQRLLEGQEERLMLVLVTRPETDSTAPGTHDAWHGPIILRNVQMDQHSTQQGLSPAGTPPEASQPSTPHHLHLHLVSAQTRSRPPRPTSKCVSPPTDSLSGAHRPGPLRPWSRPGGRRASSRSCSRSLPVRQSTEASPGSVRVCTTEKGSEPQRSHNAEGEQREC